MIYYFLLALSIILAVCKSSLYNAYARKNETTISETFNFNIISYGVASVISFVGLLISRESFSWETAICAFFYALVVISLQTISITAMKVGAMSTTSICVMYGMIIPSVAGPIFWDEPISFLQITGIFMMIVSLWLIKGKTADENKHSSKKWTALAIFAFILSGMAGVMEKIHQSTPAKDERLTFVSVACAFMLAFSVAGKVFTRGRAQRGTSVSAIRIAVTSGFVIGFYSTVNLILSGKLDSMIYYPIANGGAMLLTVAVSVLAFKERFGTCRIIGTVMGIIGILCLSIPS